MFPFKLFGDTNTPKKRGHPSTSSSSSSGTPEKLVIKKGSKLLKVTSESEESVFCDPEVEMVLTDEDLKKIEGVLEKLLSKELQTVVRTQQEISKRVSHIEAHSRAKNILITGLPEGDDSAAGNIKAIKDLCDEIGINHPMIDDVFRMGKKGATPRRMLLKLVTTVDKKSFMAHAKALRKKKIFLNDDLPSEERKQNGQLRTHFKEMKKTRAGINYSIRNCIMAIWENNKIIERYHVEGGAVKLLTGTI